MVALCLMRCVSREHNAWNSEDCERTMLELKLQCSILFVFEWLFTTVFCFCNLYICVLLPNCVFLLYTCVIGLHPSNKRWTIHQEKRMKDDLIDTIAGLRHNRCFLRFFVIPWTSYHIWKKIDVYKFLWHHVTTVWVGRIRLFILCMCMLTSQYCVFHWPLLIMWCMVTFILWTIWRNMGTKHRKFFFLY